MIIDAKELDFSALNEAIRDTDEDIEIRNCIGQRFIGSGMSKKNITVLGIPGNALGAYLNGASIRVCGNAQDALGDTMNDGIIVIDGSVGDAAGYAMRGGKIFVKGNAGYRAGIHMKEYTPALGESKIPLLVIGGTAGSFLGEYQAGGRIVVLGIGNGNCPIVSNFPCTGMHGGKMFLRTAPESISFPKQVNARQAKDDDLDEINEYVSEYCALFGYDAKTIMSAPFTVVTPDTKNPYKQLYVAN